jgi:hypothetical protein
MSSLNRRDLLKASASALMGFAERAPAAAAPFPQRYGEAAPRVAFAGCWRDLPAHRFQHEDRPTFHRLRTSLEALYSRCEQPVTLAAGKPVRITVKLLCQAEAGRTLFTLGLKSPTHGHWAFNIGACPTRGIRFGTTGWQIMVNAANPWLERVSLAGFDNRDWHTFALVIPDAQGPARLYCDGQFVMDLRQPITDQQRALMEKDQVPQRHGSIVQLVPETAGDGAYLFLESRHPGQVIDLDHVDLSQQPATTARVSVPVLLDFDWELDGMRMVENTLVRHEGNPVLSKTEVPDPTGKNYGAAFVNVLKDGRGFHMYFSGPDEISKTAGRVLYGIYHAASPDGVHWEITPKQPVLSPGAPQAWDAGTLGQSCVRKEGALYRMWYGGYVPRLQQGRAGYAESRDGIHWTKPVLGQTRYAGQPTNICLGLQPGLNSNEYELPVSVVRDETAAPSRRYVMFLHTQGPQGFIVDVATSADGYRFVRAPHNARHYAFDEVPTNTTLHGAAVVLHDRDNWWAFVGHHEPQGKGYRMRFTGWVVEPGETENVGFGLWRSHRIHLDPLPKSWEGNQPAVGHILEMGDEWWVYYFAEGNIGLAKVGRHRMYGLEVEPGQPSGSVTSIGFRVPSGGWKGHHFAVNASGLVAASRLRAELLDGVTNQPLPGFGLAEFAPLQRDGYDLPLRWKEAAVPKTEAPLRVRLTLNRGGGNPQLHAVYLRRDS